MASDRLSGEPRAGSSPVRLLIDYKEFHIHVNRFSLQFSHVAPHDDSIAMPNRSELFLFTHFHSRRPFANSTPYATLSWQLALHKVQLPKQCARNNVTYTIKCNLILKIFKCSLFMYNFHAHSHKITVRREQFHIRYKQPCSSNFFTFFSSAHLSFLYHKNF